MALARALKECARVLNSTLAYEEVLDQVISFAGRVIPHDATSILLINGGHIVVQRASGYEKYQSEPFSWKMPIAETCNLRHMLASKRPVVIPDTHQNPHWIVTPENRWIRSYAGAPIIVEDVVTGFLNFDNAISGFYTADLDLEDTLLAFADQVAIALRNARLYEQTRQEILERQQIEQTLRASEARFKVVSELMSDYAYAGHFASDGNFEFDWITGAVIRITGYSNAELMHGELWRKLIFPEDLPMVRRQFRQVKAGAPRKMLLRLTDRNGDMHWIEDHMYPVWDDNQEYVVGVIGAARDITEQRQIEEAMLRAQKLESLGVLASGIAHDFNNLLMAIMGQGTLASLKACQPQAARQHLDNVLQTVERAALLTRQLLAYTGKGLAATEPINLNHLIEQNVTILQAALPKNVVLEMNLKPKLPNVLADPGQMQQVVMNLIVNAAEAYNGRAGKVTIVTDVKNVTPEIPQSPSQPQNGHETQVVHMAVMDEGVGMCIETQKRIFDPFYTTKLTGRGLGLAAVLGIINNHQGTIQLESELGKGTTFHVFLPTTTAEEAPPASKPQAPTAVHSGLILVVDDEPVIRSALVDLLRLNGFTTLSAENGQTGLALFAAHHQEIDLVVMDMTMPVLSGEAAYYQMVDLRDDIPVIFLSGYEEEDTFRHKVDRRRTRFLHKPFDLRALLAEIQSLLGNRIAV